MFKSSYILFIFQCMTSLYQQLNMKWANKCSTALGHQMPLPGGTSASSQLYLLKMSSQPYTWLSMSSWPDVVLLLTTRCLYHGGTSALHLLKIWALEHWTICVDCSVLLLLLFHVVVAAHLPLCIHNYRWTTTKLHRNNNNNNNIMNRKINLHKLFNHLVLIILVVTV